MNTYPSLPQCDGTKLVPRSGVHVRIASNGTARARALSTAMRFDPIVTHKGIALADLQNLLAFEEANRGIAFTLNYVPEGASLTCLFADKAFDYAPVMIAGGQVAFNVTAYMVQST